MKQPDSSGIAVEINVIINGKKLGDPVGQEAQPSPFQDILGTIFFSKPNGTANVVQNPPGTYYLCVQGTLSHYAPTVWALVYPGNNPNYPQNPPTTIQGIGSATPGLASPYKWQIDQLPIDTCAPLGQTSLHTVVAWALFDGDTNYTSQPKTFNAICSTQTGCTSQILLSRAQAQSGLDEPLQPPLLGKLHDRTGPFRHLPHTIPMPWDNDTRGWVWSSGSAELGTYILYPIQDAFILYSSVSKPDLILPLEVQVLPFQAFFLVVAAEKEKDIAGFILEVIRPDDPPPEEYKRR
jgi:hypothetical protein